MVKIQYMAPIQYSLLSKPATEKHLPYYLEVTYLNSNDTTATHVQAQERGGNGGKLSHFPINYGQSRVALSS